MKKLFMAMATLCTFSAYSQIPDPWENYICGYETDSVAGDPRAADCDKNTSTYLNSYRTPGFWAPDVNNSTPIKTIRLNFVVFQNNPNTVWTNTPATISEFQNAVNAINYRYANSQPKGYPSTCQPVINHITDTKIRFVLNNVLFIQNQDAYDGEVDDDDLMSMVHSLYPQSKKCLNILLVNVLPSYPEPNNVGGYYDPFSVPEFPFIISKKMWSNIASEAKVSHFSHEIGHALGLHHSYSSEYTNITHFDFLDDVFGTCPEPILMDPLNPCYSSCGSGGACPCNPAVNNICHLKASCFLNAYPTGHPFMSGNVSKSTYISPKQAGRMHRSLSLITTDFLVPNKNMHKYVMEEYPATLPYNITSNETWDFTIKMYQNIVVKPGATLTIKCTVLMPREGKIVVEPGGKLVVDGGTITCAHDSFWIGIEAHGNSSLSQFTNQQADILLKNGAIIEHARTGVSLWKTGYALTTGSYVKAYNSTFRNNLNDVMAMFYSNDYNGNHYANKTSFTNTEFFWDDNFRATEPRAHIIMANVDGIIISGCTFADYRDPSTYSETCTGIASLDAKYKVTGRCSLLGGCSGEPGTPGSTWDPTIFENLYFGIYAENATNNYAINVDRCFFQDNGYGIELVSALSPVIIRSRFEFTNNPNHFPVTSAMYGIHAVNTKMLTIEENNFIDLAPGTHGAGSFGVVCSDLGDQDERIYKNTFQSVDYGCFSQGKNRSANTTPKGLTGLEFLCNTNITNHWDHRVRDDLWGIDGPNYGVKKTSGTYFKPIGVTYSNDIGNIYHDEDYSNSSNFPITIWNNTAQTPDDYSTSVTMLVTPNVNSCTSTLTDYQGGLHVLKPAHKSAFTAGFASAATNIIAKTTTYNNNLIDATELANIMQANSTLTPNNKQAFKNLLYQHTPFLTTDILMAVAVHPPTHFPHEWLRDLLLANIEAVTSDLFTYLSTKPYPMPAAYQQVVANAMGTTYTSRTTQESELSQLYADQSFFANRLILDKQHDTVWTDTDTLRYWLRKHNSYLYQQQIIDAYLQDRNYTQATNEINTLNTDKPNYPVDVQAEIASFVSWKNWMVTILQTPGLIAQLSQSDLTFVRNMALTGKGKAQYQAQNILCFYYNECTSYSVPSDFGTREAETSNIETVTNETAPVVAFTIRPNPATQWIAISLINQTQVNEELVILTITDLSGKAVFEITLPTNSYTVDTRNFDAGVYLVTLKSATRFIGTEKVVIQK